VSHGSEEGTGATSEKRVRKQRMNEERENVQHVSLETATAGARSALRVGRRFLWPAVQWMIALSLPFIVLTRGAMYAYQSMGWGTWPSIGLGFFGTMLVFLGYAAWLWKRSTGEGRLPRMVRRMTVAVVAGYGMYGLLYLSTGNAESPELEDYYTSLHPIMRIGASTLLLFDRDAMVTDLDSTAEDYLQMGLPVREASLHFKLGDRYVRAMDLQTTGRSPSRNRFTAGYLRFMGFRNLHNVDSADHLHLSLPQPEVR
jgi:hypothetical protein